MCYNRFIGNFSRAEYTHTLRLESELSDLRVGYANPSATVSRMGLRGVTKKEEHRICDALFLVTPTGIEPISSP